MRGSAVECKLKGLASWKGLCKAEPEAAVCKICTAGGDLDSPAAASLPDAEAPPCRIAVRKHYYLWETIDKLHIHHSQTSLPMGVNLSRQSAIAWRAPTREWRSKVKHTHRDVIQCWQDISKVWWIKKLPCQWLAVSPVSGLFRHDLARPG